MRSELVNPPPPNWDNPEGDLNWVVYKNEFYVRDVSGKEIGIYSGLNLDVWNVSGNDLVGRINSDRTRYYYLKDHLGSVRAVLDDDRNVVSAQDYDAWGYLLQNREFFTENSRYKFTSKERDYETSGYDYFACLPELIYVQALNLVFFVRRRQGARYYYSRIGRWGVVELLLENYPNLSPFVYSLNNPLLLTDDNGREISLLSIRSTNPEGYSNLLNDLSEITGLSLFVGSSGKLQYDLLGGNDYSVLSGSEIARKILINAINAKDIIEVFSTSEEISFGWKYQVNLNPDQITAFIEGVHNLNPKTMGWGMVFLHELLHNPKPAGIDLGDVNEIWTEEGEPSQGGPVIKIMNQIRRQLGEEYGKRYTHLGFERGGYTYIPFSRGAFYAFAFGRMPSAADQYIIY